MVLQWCDNGVTVVYSGVVLQWCDSSEYVLQSNRYQKKVFSTTHTHTHTDIHIHTHTHTQTQTQTQTHIEAPAQTYTHTHNRDQKKVFSTTAARGSWSKQSMMASACASQWCYNGVTVM
jgi:hypothetical protein